MPGFRKNKKKRWVPGSFYLPGTHPTNYPRLPRQWRRSLTTLTWTDCVDVLPEASEPSTSMV